MKTEREVSPNPVESVRAALVELRQALVQVLGVQVEPGAIRGTDLASRFGIDLKLAWKLNRIAKSEDPFEIVRYLPGAEGIRIFCEAARLANVPEVHVGVLSSAFATAKAAGLTWAGDSRAFELMAAGLASQRDPRVDLDQRKAHFLSGSYIWGVRAKSILRMDILKPSADSANVEMLTSRAFVDVERLRADAPWYVEVPFCVDDSGSGPLSVAFEPLDADDKGKGSPFLWKRFCSRDLPRFTRPNIERVPRVVELPVGAVGVECRFTLVHGAVVRGAMPARRTPGNEVAVLMVKVQLPCERAVLDAWIHRDLTAKGWVPTGAMYSVLDGWRGQFSHQNRDRLPIEYDIQEIAPGKRGMKLEGIEFAPALVDAGFARTGWDQREFRHFRIEIFYPPVPSTMTFEITLPE